LESFPGMGPTERSHEDYRGAAEGTRLRVGGDSGFNAILGGYMHPDGTLRRLNERAALWTGTEDRPEKLPGIVTSVPIPASIVPPWITVTISASGALPTSNPVRPSHGLFRRAV
jgi:hypothetical protein